MLTKKLCHLLGGTLKITKCGPNQLLVRQLSVSSSRSQYLLLEHFETKVKPRVDAEWLNAKEYQEIPGPSTFEAIRAFLPGGVLHNTDVITMERYYRKRYGDILCIKGNPIMGKPDVVFVFNPADFEMVYRNEGIWPIRTGLESLAHYRTNKRPDVFQGVVGLITSQGRSWGDTRNKVNPVLMKVQNIRQNLRAIDDITQEFLSRFEKLLDPHTGQLINTDIVEEFKMWAFESVAYVALNTRLGLLSRDKTDENTKKLADNMSVFFEKAYEYDVSPSIWKYYETSGFKQLMKAYDNITEVTTHYIERAKEKFVSEQNEEAKSMLEKLYRIDKKVAMVMAMDMLMAGMDTTSAVLISALYLLGQNPEKQEILRKELLTILPDPNTPLTEDKTKNMPYLRGCLKEVLRLKPIATANFRIAAKDIVLSGYKVPRGVGVYMASMTLSNSDEYFPRSKEFLPERWIKSERSTCPVAQKHNPFVYLPFGFGPRTCIGKRLAEMEIETILARFLRNYRVTWEDEKPLKYVNNLILMPSGVMKFRFDKI